LRFDTSPMTPLVFPAGSLGGICEPFEPLASSLVPQLNRAAATFIVVLDRQDTWRP
jgi:hypothetical protein